MTTTRVEEQYMDVLQNIEFAITTVFREHPELADYDVEAALEAVGARYTAEARGRVVRPATLQGLRQEVHDAILHVCEWRLGRLDSSEAASFPPIGAPLSLEGVNACIKRLRKSVRTISTEAGRQGYLRFISRFLP